MNNVPESSIVCDDLKERLVALEKLLADPLSECYIERLLDVVIAAVNDSRVLPKSKENEHMLSFCKRFINVAGRLQSYRRQPQDFSLIASLGHGAFGRVQLVREVTTGRVCAMKVLKKSRMLTQHTDYWAEREIMARGESPWIVQLYYAFQDVTCLYMVMEFVPGGNLVGWMEEVEIISEAACRFYVAETVLALSDLHAMGFIHRDLKPDNLLLDAGGHLKLADFGTAIRVDPETHLVHCDAAVGTPDYLSPEVLLSQGAGGGSYGFEVDWWALGVVIYEMLYGDTPFYSETLVNTYAKIMSHANHLKFPDGVHVSDDGLDFMKQLLRDRETRLGSGQGGSENVRSHPWFSSEWSNAQKNSGTMDIADLSLIDWTWSTIRACRPPFQPQLTSETDTSYFQLEPDDEHDHRHSLDDFGSPNSAKKFNPNSPDTRQFVGGDAGELSGIKHQISSTKFENERFLTKHPGVQLAFAGFSFSSPHPDHVALLNGLHLTPHAPSIRNAVLSDSTALDSPLVNGQSSLSNSPVEGRFPDSSLKAHPSRPARPETTDYAVPTSPTQLLRVQSQLEEALALAELHSNEVIELTEQLEKAASQRRELEVRLSQREAAHRNAVDEAHQRMESVRTEAASKLAHLEAELSKWKALAESEQTARQSAEAAGSIAVAEATARLAKQAVEVADRFAAPGSRGGLSRLASVPPSAQSDTATSSHPPLDESGIFSPTDLADSDILGTNLTTLDTQTLTTNLLTRVEEMAKRAHRAESAARDAEDRLEAEQQFCRLYKETSAEKSDRIRELESELEELRVLWNDSEKKRQRFFEDCEAARRALSEEQQRSLRYREESRVAKESAASASQRTTLARLDAAALRESLDQMKQAYEQEKSKCAAAVNKLHEVMSGTNTPALELMYLASAQPKDAGLFMGSVANRQKLAAILGNRQQQQLQQQSQKIKRLQIEIKRLQWELASSKRENSHLLMDMSRMREEEQFSATAHPPAQHSHHHSRDASDDLSGPYSNQTQSSLTSRNRYGLFGWTKGVVQAGEVSSAGTDRNVPFQKTLIPTPYSHGSSISSSPELQNTAREIRARQHSLGERTSFSTQQSSSFTPSSGAGLVVASSGQTFSPPDSLDFTLCGLLELGIKQQRRKKLDWAPRIVKLTAAYLSVWEYNQDTATTLDNSKSVPSSSTFKRAGGPITLTAVSAINTPAVLEIPVAAMYKVGPLDASEAIHERDEDLAYAFLVAYDRSYSDLSSTPAATPGQGTSLTLPRKFSFGSSSIFSTQNPHPPSTPASSSTLSNNRRVLQHQPESNASRRPTSSTQVEVTGPTSPPTSNAKVLASTVNPLRGHRFQMMKFRLGAFCDLCRKPCWHLVYPPAVLQCVHCQLKFHPLHLEAHDYEIPACGKSIVTHWFRCESKAEQQKWIAHISFAMQSAQSSQLTSPSAPPSAPVFFSSSDGRSVPQESATLIDDQLVDTTTTTQSSTTSSEAAPTTIRQTFTSHPVLTGQAVRHATLPRQRQQSVNATTFSAENRMSASFTHGATENAPRLIIEREMPATVVGGAEARALEPADSEDAFHVSVSSVITPTQVG